MNRLQGTTVTAKAAGHQLLLLGLSVNIILILSGCETVQRYSLTCRLWDTDPDVLGGVHAR